MSNKNDTSGAASGIALVGVGAFFLFAIVYALAVFVAIIFSVLCLFAWEKPLHLFGQTLTPEEAQAFVVRGLAGAMIVPGFVLFMSGLFNFRIHPDFWLHFALGGYAFGSLVVTCMIENAKTEAAEQAAEMQLLLPPQPTSRAVVTIDQPSPWSVSPKAEQQPQPFRFATWDDEEELRK